MSAFIYVEGGGSGADSKELDIRCREGFHKLLDKAGFKGRKPRLVPSGGRDAVYDRFVTAHLAETGSYVAMWIDSEEPMADIDAAWAHLESVTTVHQWNRPAGANDDQVLFMTTCMETWIVSDRLALKETYRHELQESALPPLVNLESRSRQDIQRQLYHATRNCSNAYTKGKHSYELLGELRPTALAELPSFARVRRILNDKL